MSVASVRRLGRYALHRQIAAGGMASVHLGRLMGPAGFSRTVAIKRLHPQFSQDAHFVTMFLDEARMTGRIVHPNIVSTIDVVQERGELFIVMDFVRGAALSTLMQTATARGEPIAVDIAVGVVLDTLAGLHAAHEAIGEKRQPLCVVHRDVSPHNILVGVDGLARIADFGIAKARGRMQQTAEGQIKGKLSYMPPEVLRGDDVDRRVDVYATAVVLWELLAGRKLFSGNEAAVLYDILEAELVPPSTHRGPLPPGLDDVVMKGLARGRDDRFATAADFSEALEGVVARAPARKVGAWATALAAGDLEQRAALIEDLENTGDDVLPLGASQRAPSARATPPGATALTRRDALAAGAAADEARDEDEAVSLLHAPGDPEAPPAPASAPTSGTAEPVETARRAVLRVQPLDDGGPPRRSRTAVVAAVALAAAAAVVAVVVTRGPDTPSAPSVPASSSAAPTAAPMASPAPVAEPSPSPSSATPPPTEASSPAPPPPSAGPAPPAPRPGPPAGRRPPSPTPPPLPPPEAPVL